MDQDIAVRLANEGVPVQVIARVTRLSSAAVREQLLEAQQCGDLLEIPCNDWPARPWAPLDADEKASMERAARRLLNCTPGMARLLLLLLRHGELHHDRGMMIVETETALYIHICRLRQKLRAVDCTIQSIYGYGYCMSSAHRQRVMHLLRSEA